MRTFDELSRDEVLDGVVKMTEQLRIMGGSLAGGYDIYAAVLGEWEKAKKIK